MKFSDYIGETKINPNMVHEFMRAWFKPDDKVTVVARRSKIITKYGNTPAQTALAREWAAATEEDLHGLIFDKDGTFWNLYVNLAPVKERVDLWSRGTEENVAYLPGVYVDLDVNDGKRKTGVFESQEHIYSYLDSLALKPTILCGSGSGGIHAYWRFHWDQEGYKEVIERWWSYLDVMAGKDVKIDKLTDLTRMLRLPGSVYFPKEGSELPVATVPLLEVSGITHSIESVVEVSKDAYEQKLNERKKTINRDYQERLETDSVARDLLQAATGNQWMMYRGVGEFESYVNNHMTWEEILVPFGWTHRRSLRDGSNEWARPGSGDRSAVVDFEDSPVMSLLSSSQDTGLADLKEAAIPLTKYRVARRLMFDDDTDKMVNYLIKRMQDDGII